MSELDIKLAEERLNRAKNWIEKYAPESERLEILEELPMRIKRELSSRQKEGLSSLAAIIAKEKLGPEEIHNQVYEIAGGLKMKPAELFKAIYLALLGRKAGPRVGNFITALETDFVLERFQEAAT